MKKFSGLQCVCVERIHGLVLSVALLVMVFAASPALALETVMQDDFAQASGSPVDPAKWTVSAPNIFKVNAGSSWSFFEGILGQNAAAAYAEVAGFSGKDVVVEFDLRRFGQNGNFFDLVLRQNAGGNTRVRFAANAANDRITVAIMQPGSATVSTSLGTTSFAMGQYDLASFRVRINDSLVQVFAKESWNPEFSLLGTYAPATPAYINSGAGTVRIAMPQSAADNYVYLDSFKLRQADSGKKVFADFHGYRYTREHDGQLGNWKQALQSPETPYYAANYNADLMDANGVHELAAPGEPAVGMQSYNDPDYAEYHVLTAKMAGIDGFLHEYGCSAGLTDTDVQLLQATAQTYDMEIGINWLDGFYYPFIENNTEYKAWCTANSKNPTQDVTKLEYIPQVFQDLIDWVYNKPNAATIGGRPLMPIFHGSPLTATEFATLKTNNTYTYGGQSNVVVPFLMPRWAPMGLAGSDPNVQKFWGDYGGWETHSDGSYGWKPSTKRTITSTIYQSQGDERDSKEYARAHVEGMLKTTNDRVNMAGVMPGFDNKYCASWGGYSVELLDRKNGLTYTESWEQYLSDRDVIDAVLIPTWSDHTEASGIEPMGDYGDREIRATAKYSAQFKGLADTSASLDFNLPVELFNLRKLVKFLESAGFPAPTLAVENAKLDTAGLEIANGSYAAAADRLAAVRAQLQEWRTNGIVSSTYTHSFFTGSEVVVSSGVNQNIDIPTATADFVRSRHFDGVITFEYLDNSTFAANKTLYLFSTPTPASTGKPGEWRVCQMQMRHGNGDGLWKTARVQLNKKNLPLTSGGIDLYFSASGGASNGGTIRNVTVSLTSYSTIPGTWDAGAGTADLLTAANWAVDAVPASTSAAAEGRQDARWDGSVTGPLNLTFGAAFGGSYGVGVVMTSNQTSSLTITNSAALQQNLRIVNSTASTNGGIQIASGAGPLTIGAAGSANPIQLVLGAGTTALNYYFANNTANTATIEENVTIARGGTHNASLIFDGGSWTVKGAIGNLSAADLGGSLNVNAGSVTLSGNNTAHTGSTFVNGGTLILSGTGTLGTTTVNGGTLRFDQPGMTNSADVRLFSSASINLNFSGTNTISRLYIDGLQQVAGTWGASGSGAQYESSAITGTGLIQVTNAPASGTWGAGGPATDLLNPTNWWGNAVPTNNARWDGLVTGPLNLTFGAAFGGSTGVGLVMTSNQTSSLTITNSAVAIQDLRLVNSTASTNGGIQIASGAGALTIGAAGTNNPIQLILGSGTNAVNYYFANNSTNTATIKENVTILKDGSHAAGLIFSAGAWDVKSVVSDLGAGTFNVNAGSVTLSGANTFTAGVNINGGTLSINATNNLGAGTGSVRLGQTTTSGTLEFIGTNNTTISRLMRIGNGATAAADTGSATINNNGAGVLTFNNTTFNEVGNTSATSDNRSLSLGGTNTGNNTISGVIANNNPGLVSVVKKGTGKWILSGTNTFSNGATIDEGTLVVGHDNALGTGTINLKADAAGDVARLQSDGTARTFTNAVTFGGAAAATANYLGGAGTGKLTFNGTINWGTGSKTYTIDGSTVEFGGSWTGSHATAINTIDGTDTATSLVILNSDRGTAAKEIVIENNVTVRANHANSFGSDNTELLTIYGSSRTGVVELQNGITLARTLTVQGRSTSAVALRNLSGNNSLSLSVGAGGEKYNIESTAGTLTISAVSGSTGDRDLFVTGAGNVTLTNWNSRRALTKDGAGTLTISGASTHTGDTSVNAGILQVNQLGMADSADVLLSTSASLVLTFSGTDTIDELFVDGQKQGHGTWGSVGSAAQNKTSLITGAGLLQVTNGTPYSVWAEQEGILGQPPEGDYDADGYTNEEERLLGTDPNDSQSLLVFQPAVSTGSGFQFSFNSMTGRQYSVEFRDSLMQGTWSVATNIIGTGSEQNYTETSTNQFSRFYRIRVTSGE